MSDILLHIDEQAISVPAGASVAAAIAHAKLRFRMTGAGAPRSAVCGMGVCFECRVRINGADQQRACMVPASAGMRVTTGQGLAPYE